MKNSWSNYNKYIEYPKSGVLSKQLPEFKEIDITLFCMTGGTEISKHTSARHGLVFVLEGKGIFNLEENNIIMEPGTIINMNKNATHSLKAEINTSFLLILFNK